MDEIEIAFNNAVEKALADDVTGINLHVLMNQSNFDYIKLIAKLLDKVSEPSRFFDKWAGKGNKTVDGFYVMLDMFCYLLIKNGPDHAQFLRKYQNSKSRCINEILDLYNNERISAEIVKTFSESKNTKKVTKKKSNSLDILNSSILISKPKAVTSSKNYWELRGESVVMAKCVKRSGKNHITVTAYNSYGPIKNLKVYAYICTEAEGNIDSIKLYPKVPWENLSQVEDMILIEKNHYKNNGGEPISNPCQEIPWWGTYKMSYLPPTEEHNIKLMFVDASEFNDSGELIDAYNSGVISDWVV